MKNKTKIDLSEHQHSREIKGVTLLGYVVLFSVSGGVILIALASGVRAMMKGEFMGVFESAILLFFGVLAALYFRYVLKNL